MVDLVPIPGFKSSEIESMESIVMPKTKMNNGKPQAYVIDNISIFVCVNLRTRIVVLCKNLNIFQHKLLKNVRFPYRKLSHISKLSTFDQVAADSIEK